MLSQSQIFAYFNFSLTVSSYCISSISWIIVSNFLVNGAGKHVHVPVLTAWAQSAIVVVMSFTLTVLAKICPIIFDFPDATFDYKCLKEMTVPSLFYIIMITCLNYSMINVKVPFIVVATSLSIVFSYVFSFWANRKNISTEKLLCCVLVLTAFSIGVDQENVATELPIKGIMFAVIASFAAAVHCNLTTKQSDIPKTEEPFWKKFAAQNFLAFLILTPFLFLSGEISETMNSPFLGECFWPIMAIGGIFRFLWAYSGYCQEMMYSEAAHNVIDIVRATIQIGFTVYFYGESNSVMWYASNTMIIAGFIWNHLIRQKETDEIVLFHRLGDSTKKLLAEEEGI